MMGTLKKKLGIILTIIATIVVAVLILVYYKEFSTFGVMMLMVDGAVLQLYLFDKYLLGDYDTIEELQKGNVAVGLALLAYAVVVGSAMLAAFLTWV